MHWWNNLGSAQSKFVCREEFRRICSEADRTDKALEIELQYYDQFWINPFAMCVQPFVPDDDPSPTTTALPLFYYVS